MLYSFRLLLFLIDIDQNTILEFEWVGGDLKTKTSLNTWQNITTEDSIDSIDRSVQSLKLLIGSSWQKIQAGLELSDIENIMVFLVFVRFIILIFRYNLKTSTYITLVGICAGYLWYRHFIDMISWYSHLLVKIPYLENLGTNMINLEDQNDLLVDTDMKLGSNVHWYNPGKLLYYAFTKGIIQTDPDSGLQYYIDPISMMVSNLDEKNQAFVLPYYYKIYNSIIPRSFEAISAFWSQLSGLAAYTMITRIGKRYCPYLVRWHWTFLLIFELVEQVIIFFVYRVAYFQQAVLEPDLISSNLDPNILFQFNILNIVLAVCITLHLGLLLFALLHAVCGQYFYFPFFVENTELHIGPRPKNSIYSGGKTAWQDEKETNIQRTFPKLWYGWFGSGTSENWIFSPFKQFLITTLDKIKNFRKRGRRKKLEE